MYIDTTPAYLTRHAESAFCWEQNKCRKGESWDRGELSEVYRRVEQPKNGSVQKAGWNWARKVSLFFSIDFFYHSSYIFTLKNVNLI